METEINICCGMSTACENVRSVVSCLYSVYLYPIYFSFPAALFAQNPMPGTKQVPHCYRVRLHFRGRIPRRSRRQSRHSMHLAADLVPSTNNNASKISAMSLPTTLNHTLVPMPTRQHSDRAEALLTLSIALIDSALDILQHRVHTDEQLTRDSALLPGGTLGKHFRHVSPPLYAGTLTSAGHRDVSGILIAPLSRTHHTAAHPRDQLRCHRPVFPPPHRTITRCMSSSYASSW